MSYRTFNHTADIGIIVEARTREGIFEEAGRGMFDIIGEIAEIGDVNEYKFELSSGAYDSLLVDFLSELLFLHETESAMFSKFNVELKEPKHSGENIHLSATVRGERICERHTLKTAIKAITYHTLSFEKVDKGYMAKVLFDI